WIKEVLFNCAFVLKNIKDKPVLMVADPLNGTVGIFLGWKFSKKYYHCIDYSENRFSNKILNKVYLSIIYLSLMSFDMIGVTSQRIKGKVNINKSISSKVIYVPNAMPFKEIKKPVKL